MCNPLDNLHLLPPLLALFLVSACISSYSVAVYLQHVRPVFPYISYAGSRPPESCIFSQLLGMASIVAGLVMFFEFRFLTLHIPRTQRLNWRANQLALVVGFISCVGANFIANFQITNIRLIHLIAAGMLFLGVVFYGVLFTFLTIRLRSVLCYSWFLVAFRLVFSSLSVMVMTVCVAAGMMGEQHHEMPANAKVLKDQRRVNLYLVSTFSEWIVVFLMLIYFFSLMPDLRRVRARWMSVELKQSAEANHGELVELRVATAESA